MFQLENVFFEVVPFGGFLIENDCGSGSGNLDFEEQNCDEKITEVPKQKIKIQIAQSSLDWIKKNKIEELPVEPPKKMTKGGGQQLNVKESDGKVNPKIREILEKLAQGEIFQKKRGDIHWDGKILAKNLASFQYGNIPISKHDWKPKKIYFFVDTSGSVWYLASLIITLIKSTSTSKTIRVFSGSESHPNKDENSEKILCESRKRYLDESMIDLFKIEKPDKDTTFVFWGDLQGAGIRPQVLKDVLKPYKTIWLNPSDKSFTLDETNAMRLVCPVYKEMNTTEKIIKQIKQII